MGERNGVCIPSLPSILALLWDPISRVRPVSVCSGANGCSFLGGSPRFRDAWAKHKDLDSYEAKWLYVDALMKVTSRRGVCFSIFDEAAG